MKIQISVDQNTTAYCPKCDKFITEVESELELEFHDIHLPGIHSEFAKINPEDLIGKKIAWIEDSPDIDGALILTLE